MAGSASLAGRRAFVRLRALFTMALACAVLQAAGSDSEPETAGDTASPYTEGLELVASQDYEKALERFQVAIQADPSNPDVLNMLAFTQRKSGDLRSAFATYARALGARSEFPQAREYLGEAHIQAAMEEILTLKGYGAESEAHLAALIDALVGAAERAQAMRPAGVEPAGKW